MTKKQHIEEIPLDDYERELQEFIEAGEYLSDPDFPKNKKIYEEAAKHHVELEKSKSITVRIKKRDLAMLKAKADRNNIPYQTLINLLITHYNAGKTKINL